MTATKKGFSPAEKAAQEELRQARRGFLWLLLPKIPVFLRLVLARLFGVSETARYLDLSSDLKLTMLRSIVHATNQPIGQTQAFTLLDPGVKGRLWISNAVAEVPPEHEALRDALRNVIVAMGGTDVEMPNVVPVEAEWTGYRGGVAKDAPLPVMSEVSKYEALMKETKNKTTILYFHGGAYYLCDPSSHRSLTKRLAKATGGRVYSVRYRLAPQNPFPTQLLDALVSYFTLLYPPPGSMHEAVPAEKIVFGGDSAGGNLALVLTQTLMHLHSTGQKIPWFGQDRHVPLPGGLTLFSPWADPIHTFPSWTTNQKWDYLPSLDLIDLEISKPPADAIWPANPPRKRIYVADHLALHPLVSVHLARSWRNCPPVWISCGWECLADEDRYLVSRLRKDEVPVVFEEFEAMPHVFPAVLPKLAETKRCIRGLARFVGEVMEECVEVDSRYTYIEARTLKEKEGDVRALEKFSEGEVWELACARVGRDAVDGKF